MARRPKRKARYPLISNPVIDKWTIGLRGRAVTLKFRAGETYEAATPEELRKRASSSERKSRRWS